MRIADDREPRRGDTTNRNGLPLEFTNLRATLVFVADNQNITLSLPRELLKRIKRLAADRETSVSALMSEALTRVADEDRRYSVVRKRALSALRSARSLGTGGRRTWTRDELHER
jgi:predicted transcriptional regulator